MEENECPNIAEHHPATLALKGNPIASAEWAAGMSKAYRQEKCNSCGLWVIWRRKGMNVGDRVQTVQKWNDEYCKDGLRGTILQIPLHGPVHKGRNHYVVLDEPYGSAQRLWFHPDDLLPEGS